MVAPIRFLSGRQQQQKIGIEGSTENEKVLEVVGRVGIGTTIFDANVELEVRGDVNISGVLTAGNFSVTGVSTFTSDLDINASIDVDGHTELDDLNVSGFSTFASNVDINASVDISNDLNVSGVSTFISNVDISNDLNVSGVSTFASDLDINASVDISNDLNVSGVSTFSSSVDINASIDVDGHTELDDLNVSGVSTFTSDLDINASIDVDGHTELDNLNVSGVSTFASNVDVNASIDVDGHTELDNLNVSGVSTFASDLDINASVDISNDLNVSGVSTFASDLDINASVDISNDLNVSGVSTFSSNVDINASIDVDGHTELDNLNVSGVSTFSSNVDVNASIDVDGHTELDNLNVSGVSTFIGAITGTISTATKLENARTFEITGDVVASPIAFDGTGNVSLAATIQPNSVGLGTDTFGDYVKNISGTANEIIVTGGTGEGSTPVISIDPNPTLGGNVVIGNDLQINNNLNVTGNITIGGTTGYILVDEFRVQDKDIILGFTTDLSGNDVSNDTTANGGGIAIASTEGSPLVCLQCAGINTFPGTYKQLIWYKAGTFSGLNTDAWLSNYAIGIGSTQVPNGVRLAAGGVQLTDNDIIQVRNINSSGISTFPTIDVTNATIDNLTFTSGTPITSVDNDLTAVSASDDTLASAKAIKDYVDTQNLIQDLDFTGDSGSGSVGINTETFTISGTLNEIETVGSGLTLTIGLPDEVAITTSLTVGSATTIDSGGINSPTGIITALQFVGTASTASFATTAFTLNGTSEINLSVGSAITATNLEGGIAGNLPYQSAPDTTTFVTNGAAGQVLLFNGSVPSWGNISASSGFFGGVTIEDEGIIVGTSGSIATINFTGNNIEATATSGASGISTITLSDTPTFDSLEVTGIATLGITTVAQVYVSGVSTFNSDVEVGTGITFYASTGIISATAFFGNGENLTDLINQRIEGLRVYDEGSPIGVAYSISSFDFRGNNITATTVGLGTTALVEVSDTPIYDSLEVTGISTLGISSLSQIYVSGVSTFVSNVDIDASIDVDGHTELDDLNVSGFSTFSNVKIDNGLYDTNNAIGSNLQVLISTGIGISWKNFNEIPAGDATTLDGLDSTQFLRSDVADTKTGITTFSDPTTFNSYLDINSFVDISNNLNVSGVSTFASNVDINASIDVDGHTELDNLNVSGVSTFAGIGTFQSDLYVGGDLYVSDDLIFDEFTARNATLTGNLQVSGVSTFSSNIDINASIDVDGHTELDNLNVSGVSTFASNVDINASVDISNNINVSGISTLDSVQISSGIVTAASGIVTYYGDGQYLQNIITGVGVDTNTTDQAQYIPYATSFGSTTGLGATSLLVYNPSTIRLGIGTTNPQSNLYVVGNVLVTGVVTATSFSGNATSSTYATTAGIATYADVAGIATAAVTAGTATTATNIDISATSTGDTTTHVVLVGNNVTGGQQPFIDNGSLTYNGSTNVLTAGGFSGDGSALTALNGSQVTSGTIPGDRGVTSGSTSSSFVEYNGTTKTAGQFDGGTTDPSNTTRLNYDGYFYATRFYGDSAIFGSNVTINSTGINATGIVTATDFNSTSDAKLKTNIQTIENPLEKVNQLDGVTFNWIADNRPSMGVIADEVEKILPELVSNTDPKTVNYNGLIGLLIEAIKKLKIEVEELKNTK